MGIGNAMITEKGVQFFVDRKTKESVATDAWHG